jgi:hypothetical protein
MPLAATLGDLHQAIHVLFGWDGDHLHAFTVADMRYSASLAVESVRRWWRLAGRDACPRATRLLVTCDAGGQLLEEPRLEERPGPEPVSLS